MQVEALAVSQRERAALHAKLKALLQRCQSLQADRTAVLAQSTELHEKLAAAGDSCTQWRGEMEERQKYEHDLKEVGVTELSGYHEQAVALWTEVGEGQEERGELRGCLEQATLRHESAQQALRDELARETSHCVQLDANLVEHAEVAAQRALRQRRRDHSWSTFFESPF